MELRAGYKNSEIGVIPNEWEVICLGDVFDFKNGLNKEKQYFGQGTPIVNYMDVYKKSSLVATDLAGKVTLTSQEIKNYEVKKGDVFFTRTSETVDEIGVSAVMLEDVKDTVFSGFVLRARPINEKLDIEFKKYCFSTQEVRKEITSKSSYTTRALTNGRLLSGVKMAIPKSLSEQTAIATALSDADALISSLEKLIAKKRNIKQGAMQKLLQPKEGWEVKKLGEVAEIYTGKKNNQDKVENGIYPFFVRSQTIERINSYSFDGEAILIPGEGNIGKIFHYINGKFDYHQRVYKISDFKSGYFSKYIYRYISEYFGRHAMENSVKATVDSLRLPTFQVFEIPFPPTYQEQENIATILSDMDNEINALETKLDKYKNIKLGMMQNLLTGKIRLV